MGVLPLPSGRLCVSDAKFAPDPAVPVRLEPGDYEVWVQEFVYEDDHEFENRHALLRVLKPGTNPQRGEKIDNSWADTGTQGVCDFEQMLKLQEEVGEDDYIDAFEEAWSEEFILQPKADTAALLFVVHSGFGDGTFPVFELVQDVQLVGVEVELIAPGTPHPFWD